MNIEYRIEPEPDFCVGIGSLISYRQTPDKGIICLHSTLCKKCNADVGYPERYAHAIEHEVTELLTNLIRLHEGEKWPLNMNDFDNIFCPYHQRVDTHICDDGLVWELRTQ